MKEYKLRRNLLAILILTAVLFGCSKSGARMMILIGKKILKQLCTSKKENKAVLVNFTGSDWCIWCKRLTEEVFAKGEFEDYASDNLILVKLDFPRKIEQASETKMYNNNLAQKFGVQGFPTILLFNSTGKLVLTTGYQPGGPASYVNHLKSYL